MSGTSNDRPLKVTSVPCDAVHSGDHRQQRALVLEARQQELPHAQPAVFEDRAADQKRLRAGAAGKTGRLEIEESRAAVRTTVRDSRVSALSRLVAWRGQARASTSSASAPASSVSTMSPIRSRPCDRSAA